MQRRSPRNRSGSNGALRVTFASEQPDLPAAVTPPPGSEKVITDAEVYRKGESLDTLLVGDSSTNTNDSNQGNVVARDDDGEPLYSIDRILEERTRYVGKDSYTHEYRVKWQGYAEDHEECQMWCPSDWLTKFAIAAFQKEQMKRKASENESKQNMESKKQAKTQQHTFDNIPDILVGLEEANGATFDDLYLSYEELEQVQTCSNIQQETAGNKKESPRKPKTPLEKNAKIRKVLKETKTKGKSNNKVQHKTADNKESPKHLRAPPKKKAKCTKTRQIPKTKDKSKRKENVTEPPCDGKNGKVVAVDVDGAEYYEVESVWGHRIIRGVHQYRVKWAGYSKKDMQWYPQSCFAEYCYPMLQDFRKKQELEATPGKVTTQTRTAGHESRSSSRVEGVISAAISTGAKSTTSSVATIEEPITQFNAQESAGHDKSDCRPERRLPESRASKRSEEPGPGIVADNIISQYGSGDESSDDETGLNIFKESIRKQLQRLARCPGCKRGIGTESLARTPIMSRNCQHTICVRCIAKIMRDSGNREEWMPCPVVGCGKQGCFSNKSPNKNKSLLRVITGMQELLAHTSGSSA